MHRVLVGEGAYLARDAGGTVLQAAKDTAVDRRYRGVVDAPRQLRRVVRIRHVVNRGRHIHRVGAVVDHYHGLVHDGWLRGKQHHGDRGRHVAQPGLQHAGPRIAAGREHRALANAQTGVGAQRHALHIGVDQLATRVVAQDARTVRRVDRHLHLVVGKGYRGHHIVLLADGLHKPSAGYGARRALGGGVDD